MSFDKSRGGMVQKLLAAQGSLQQAAAASVPSQLEPPSPHEGPSQGNSGLEGSLGPNEVLPKKRRLNAPSSEPQPPQN